VLTTLNAEIATMQAEVAAQFGQHPDAEIYLSQPFDGMNISIGCRVTTSCLAVCTALPRPQLVVGEGDVQRSHHVLKAMWIDGPSIGERHHRLSNTPARAV
jgi:hypothetical protein